MATKIPPAIQARVAKKLGVPADRAAAILASASRHAAQAAKRTKKK